MQVFIDSLQMFSFPGYSLIDAKEFKEMMTESSGAMDFYGNKILKEDKEAHTNWYNSLKDLNKGILSFILKNLNNCAKFRGQEDPSGAEAFLKSIFEAAMKG
jgi:hypothetical protein